MDALSMKARSLTDGNGLSSLKQVSCGAASITTKVIGDFLHAFPRVDFIQGYGMTESTAVGTRGFNMENSQKHTSIGLLAPNMEAKEVNWTTGSCLPPGKVGELLLRGPGVMKVARLLKALGVPQQARECTLLEMVGGSLALTVLVYIEFRCCDCAPVA